MSNIKRPLTLKIDHGERVYIGDDINIKNTTGQTIELEFIAPKELRVLRESLYNKETSLIEAKKKASDLGGELVIKLPTGQTMPL